MTSEKIQYKLLLPLDLHQMLIEQAKASGRSLSSEIVMRLQGSFDPSEIELEPPEVDMTRHKVPPLAAHLRRANIEAALAARIPQVRTLYLKSLSDGRLEIFGDDLGVVNHLFRAKLDWEPQEQSVIVRAAVADRVRRMLSEYQYYHVVDIPLDEAPLSSPAQESQIREASRQQLDAEPTRKTLPRRNVKGKSGAGSVPSEATAEPAEKIRPS